MPVGRGGVRTTLIAVRWHQVSSIEIDRPKRGSAHTPTGYNFAVKLIPFSCDSAEKKRNERLSGFWIDFYMNMVVVFFCVESSIFLVPSPVAYRPGAADEEIEILLIQKMQMYRMSGNYRAGWID